jgi:hypothetical protein
VRGARFLAALLPLCIGTAALAQTDEIQVYDAEIDDPGQFSLTLHDNYTPDGRKSPDYPGAIVPDHAWNGVAEWALGVEPWLELGAYFPLYSLTNDGRMSFNGGKLRALFVEPDAREQPFIYGINFEFSFNARHWEQHFNSGEIRPILGVRFGRLDLIANPIFDTDFNGISHLDFAPAERVAWHLDEDWAVAAEHYADFGIVSHWSPLDRQQQTLFAVVDWSHEPDSAEFGIGHGFTAGSDALVLKLILTHAF